jgi:UrcA family protein
MSFLNHAASAVTHRVGSSLTPAVWALALLTLFAVAPAAFLMSKESSDLPPTRSARVWLVDLDLSTPDGARDARERIRNAARELCARNLGRRSLDFCVDDLTAAAQRQIKARTMEVSLADLDLSTSQGVHVARDRLQAAARRVCRELQTGHVALSQYAACVDETFAHALRQADLLQRTSVDF